MQYLRILKQAGLGLHTQTLNPASFYFGILFQFKRVRPQNLPLQKGMCSLQDVFIPETKQGQTITEGHGDILAV